MSGLTGAFRNPFSSAPARKVPPPGPCRSGMPPSVGDAYQYQSKRNTVGSNGL